MTVRAISGIALCAVALLGSSAVPAAPGATADTGLANYAFASEVGSGVYEINGSTIYVYRVTPYYWLRDTTEVRGRPGLKLILPITFGFFDFKLSDLAHLEFPNQVGAVSLEPGIEFDYWLHESWHVFPYVKGGATFASSAEVNAYIYGLGVRSELRFQVRAAAGLWTSDLTHAGVHYKSDLPNDSFTRWRNGVELRRAFGADARERRFELGVYGVTDIYLDAPQGPASGLSARTLQFEGGLMFGVSPMYQLWGVTLPRLGIGYREAGVLSGWRLVIGDPF